MSDNQILYSTHEELVIMVRSKPRPKREKKEESTDEFVARMSLPKGERNGLKKNLKGARR